MNYFISDIHGASEAYFKTKKNIGFKKNDELYILGDIFDGNDTNPGACLEILDDIMLNNNIHLILGNHEYAHVMFHVSASESEDSAVEWEAYLSSPDFGGAPLLRHFKNHLSEKERSRYISFLVSCEMTEMVTIGKRNFYLVHGSPIVCKNEDICEWQRDVSSTELELSYNPSLAISSDPYLELPKEIDWERTFVIAGHKPTRKIFEDHALLFEKYYNLHQFKKYQKVVFENKKFLIDCGCNGNSIGWTEDGWTSDLACLAIDAAGFFSDYLLQNDDEMA